MRNWWQDRTGPLPPLMLFAGIGLAGSLCDIPGFPPPANIFPTETGGIVAVTLAACVNVAVGYFLAYGWAGFSASIVLGIWLGTRWQRFANRVDQAAAERDDTHRFDDSTGQPQKLAA
ncbi:hypothetical protein [Stratiformator vulcanicus]|uniref:Uncharacterized protein n=1 Tax=Stratiformator vulcanicus TaxID=2527980 RepID=A0A517QXS4_9PLAN|nr:hypothetical protein [Stratiformator vulcanicus]QDT36407.1 hypothetical protein Pan189_07630 [Stratiformator vulcanicus]